MPLVADLDTPSVTIDLDIMEANIRRVQAHLNRLGVANRPHVKTHKIPALGKRQMAAGAVGIICHKRDELYGVCRGLVEKTWPVAARGAVR